MLFTHSVALAITSCELASKSTKRDINQVDPSLWFSPLLLLFRLHSFLLYACSFVSRQLTCRLTISTCRLIVYQGCSSCFCWGGHFAIDTSKVIHAIWQHSVKFHGCNWATLLLCQFFLGNCLLLASSPQLDIISVVCSLSQNPSNNCHYPIIGKYSI